MNSFKLGLCSVTFRKKSVEQVVEIAKGFADLGFNIVATGTTCDLINAAGIEAQKVKKLSEGRPNILDLITNSQIDLIINTPIGADSATDDSYLRKGAIKKKIPYMTTIAAAKATASGMISMGKPGCGDVKSLQEWHSEIKDK